MDFTGEYMIVNPQKINWESIENYLFIHSSEKNNYDFIKKTHLKSHIFITTSGSKQKKCIALSKKAFLNSAKEVNAHLKAQKKDKWLIVLPLFHVGGLSILARSFLSQSDYFFMEGSWNPLLFVNQMKSQGATLTSLVPTQVYDLVVQNIKAPPFIRAVIVGGGSLAPYLYQEARKLHWPLIPSYGLTEVCSQVATAELDSLNKSKYPSLKILQHCQVQTEKGIIKIKSSSLLTGWYDLSQNNFHPCNESYLTEDRGEILKDYLKVEGRDQAVKIKGHNVSILKLKNILNQICLKQKVKKDYLIIATNHPRTEYQINLVTNEFNSKEVEKIIHEFNHQVLPFERILSSYVLSKIPYGELKAKQGDLKNLIGARDVML